MKIHALMGAIAATIAAPALATVGQATIADGYSFASTCAGTTYGAGITPGEIILGGISNGAVSCHAATSATYHGTASVTSSFAGLSPVPFSNAATASSTPGTLHLSAANTGAGSDYFPGAEAVAGWNDSLVNPNGVIGQASIWLIPIHVDGSLSVAGGGRPATSFNITVFKDHQRLSHYDAPTYASFLANNPAMPYSDEDHYDFDQGRSWGIERLGVDRIVPIDATVWFAVPFVYGTPFTLGVYADVVAGEASYGNSPTLNTSAADFAHTITWGGKGFTVAADGAGPHVTNFTISSLSGFNYNESAVPEPETWALLLAGFGAVAAAARRRREPVLAVA